MVLLLVWKQMFTNPNPIVYHELKDPCTPRRNLRFIASSRRAGPATQSVILFLRDAQASGAAER
jgi:hypothetical protein